MSGSCSQEAPDAQTSQGQNAEGYVGGSGSWSSPAVDALCRDMYRDQSLRELRQARTPAHRLALLRQHG